MTSPAILARLTPSSCDLHYHSGGIPEITNGEIAGALAKCSEGAKLYAAVQYQGAREYEGLLMSEIRLALSGIWARKGWRIQKPGLLQGLAWLGIFEDNPANTRCGKCNGAKGLELDQVCRRCYGTGGHRDECRECGGSGKETISCALCGGTGVQNPTDEARQQIVQQYVEGPFEWGEDIRRRYEATVPWILSGYNSEVWTNLAQNLEVDGDF